MIRLPALTPWRALSLAGLLLFFACSITNQFTHAAYQREYQELVRQRDALSARHAAATRAADPAAPAIQSQLYATVARHSAALLLNTRRSLTLSWVAFAGLILWISRHVPGVAAYLRRKHRKRTGRCQACGYDLTGNQSGTCPECGTRANVARLP